MHKNLGFTLLELIIVVTIIALLAAATFVAVDPAKRIGQAQNAQRWSDVTAILNAIMNYTVDNNGTFPSGITQADTKKLGTGASGCNDCTASTTDEIDCDDLSSDLVDTYLATIPVDPSQTSHDGSDTGYYIYRPAGSNRITVGACTTYNSETIEVSR